MNKLKLSAKQKEVIKLMRDGHKLCRSYTLLGDYVWLCLEDKNDRTNIDLRPKTLDSLSEKLIVQYIGREHKNSIFSLTELGKTISLD